MFSNKLRALLGIILLWASCACAQVPMTGAGVGAPTGGGGANNLLLDSSTGGNTTTTSLALTITTTHSPDLLYLILNDGSGATPSTTCGTWTEEPGSPYSAGGHNIRVWTAPISGTLSSCVTTITGTSGFATGFLLAWNGYNSGSIFDSGAPVSGTPDPQLITTTNKNDVIIGMCNSGTGQPTAGSGFTIPTGGSGAGWYAAVEYKIVSATQTALSVGWTTGTGNCHTMVVDAVKSS